MRIPTNHLMQDIRGELEESGIWCQLVEPAQTHTTWCEMAETGHMGPCRANYLVEDIEGISGYEVVQHANGHMCIAIPRNHRIRTETAWNRLMSQITDLVALGR